jgi:putative ABC transport system permease protein
MSASHGSGEHSVKFLHLVWRNLLRRKLRTSLTVLSVAVAFVLFCFLGAIEKALTGGVELAGANRLIVRNRVSLIQPLPESYQARIIRMAGVAAATHSSWFGGVYQEPKNFFPQIAVEPADFLAMFPEFVLSDAAKQRWYQTRNGAVVGRNLAQRFGWQIGDRIPIQATVWEKKDGSRVWEFELVGIYQGATPSTDLTQFFFRYDYFDEARAFYHGRVGWYTVRVDDPEHADRIAGLVDTEFANSAYETKTESEKAFIGAFVKQIGDITTIMVAILSAVFFTILLVTGNTMAQAVRERTEEIGVLKALGYANGRVLILVLLESVLLSGAGGLAGLGCGWALTSRGDPTDGMLPLYYLPPGQLLVGAGLVLLLGIVSGVLPAVAAMRLGIADALRRA